MIDLDHIERALERAFPDLDRVAPLRMLGYGFSSVAVETAGGAIFRVARNADAGAHYAKEAQNLPALMPYLRVAIPEPQWYLPASADFPFGVIGYHKLPGVPLEPDALAALADAQEAASQIAAIILALHRVPLGAVSVDDDRDRVHAQWVALCDDVLPVLWNALPGNEYQAIAQWWDAFLADELMAKYTPVVQHGDLWFGNLLVKDRRVTGVVDWERLGVGDPAQDFVPQLYLGQTFLNLVVEAYRGQGGELDPYFYHRLRHLFSVREFGGLQYSIRYDDTEEFADSIDKLRKGPILHPSRLDGWHRDWTP